MLAELEPAPQRKRALFSAYANLARNHLAQTRFEEARSIIARLPTLAGAEDSYRIAELNGRVYEGTGKYAEAIGAYRLALDGPTGTGNVYLRTALLQIRIARLEIEHGDPKQGELVARMGQNMIDTFEIRDTPEQIKFKHLIALALIKQGRPGPEAAALLRAAVVSASVRVRAYREFNVDAATEIGTWRPVYRTQVQNAFLWAAKTSEMGNRGRVPIAPAAADQVSY